MPSLLESIYGIRGCQDQRPSRDQFTGINVHSIQANGLAAWWPMWEPMSNAQKAPAAMDYGPYGMHMTPAVNVLHAGDPQMGTCWFGKPNPGGISGAGSGQCQYRPYAWGTTLVDPVDFGALPDTTKISQAYMSSAWIKTSEIATRYSRGSPLDIYIYSFDRNDSFGYPGHTLGVIMQGGNGVSGVTGAAATMYDNDAGGSVPFGVQSCQLVNDGLWHLICGIYLPIGFSAGNAANTAWQIITVDGDIGPVSGADDQSVTGTVHPFGISKSQSNLGSPQDAGHTAGSPVFQFVGSDDDGISSEFLGYISDHRLYALSGLGMTNNLDLYQYAVSLAQHMYAPETRWELYQSPKRQVALRSGAITNTYNDSGRSGLVIGGFSFPPATFAPTPSAGVVPGGMASDPATFVPPPSAGTMIGALAASPATFAPSPSSGAIVGALAAVPATFAPTPASGIVAGGLATTPATYAAVASAGVVPGSAASSPASYVTAGVSGVVPGGVAASPATYAASGASGAVMGSVAATVATFATDGASGVSIGTVINTGGSTFTDSGFAGVGVGSIANVAATYATPSSSGVTAGTTMTAPATFAPTASSGANVGSIAFVPATFAPTPSAGAITGALAAVLTTFAPLASSGVAIGEIASTVATFGTAGASGVAIGSYNSPGNTYANSGSSGISLGTVATVGSEFTKSGSAGIVLGPSPDTSTTFEPTGSAGVAVGTYASIVNVFVASGSAGIRIGTSAFASTADIVSGGIGYGGSASELFVQHWMILPFYPSPLTAKVFSASPSPALATIVQAGISPSAATVKPKGE